MKRGLFQTKQGPKPWPPSSRKCILSQNWGGQHEGGKPCNGCRGGSGGQKRNECAERHEGRGSRRSQPKSRDSGGRPASQTAAHAERHKCCKDGGGRRKLRQPPRALRCKWQRMRPTHKRTRPIEVAKGDALPGHGPQGNTKGLRVQPLPPAKEMAGEQ